jgi:hypothetical protein
MAFGSLFHCGIVAFEELLKRGFFLDLHRRSSNPRKPVAGQLFRRFTRPGSVIRNKFLDAFSRQLMLNVELLPRLLQVQLLVGNFRADRLVRKVVTRQWALARMKQMRVLLSQSFAFDKQLRYVAHGPCDDHEHSSDD